MNISIRPFIALFLSAALIFQTLSPAYAQLLPQESSFNAFPLSNFFSDTDSEAFRINSKFLTIPGALSFEAYKADINTSKSFREIASLTDEDYNNLYSAYKKALVEQEYAVDTAYAHIKKTYDYRIEDALYAANKQNQNGDKAEICDNGKCFDTYIYNLALLRALLKDGAGIEEKNKKWQWNREIMLGKAKEIYNIISYYGVSYSDTPLAQKYFRFLLEKTSDFCDNDVYMYDIAPGLAGGSGRADARQGKERRQKECSQLGLIALSLGSLDNISYQDKNANAELLYKQLEENYREDYGALVFGNYITALLMLGNNKAYEYLEKFILKDSLADGLRVGGFWQVVGKALDIISIKAWVDKFIDINNRSRGRGGRYLNEVGLRFQYIDEKAAAEYGYSDFSISLAKQGLSGYNMPYGNIYEDIGELFSQWPDKRAAKIANKALNEYALALRQGNAGYGAAHIPFITGAIKGGGVSGSNVNYVIDKLYTLDWWDLNEGTQRRINNIMAKVSKKYSAGYKPIKSKDEVKIARADTNNKVANLAIWSDLLVGAIFITAFVASIPSIARSTASFIKTVNASRSLKAARIAKIKAAGKGNLLKKVHTQIKASGVKPVKPAVKPNTPAPATPAKEVYLSKKKLKGKTTKDKRKHLSSVADKHRGANAAAPQTAEISHHTLKRGTVETPLIERPMQPVQNQGAFTVSIGEGSSGAANSRSGGGLTRAQRLHLSQQEAERELALMQETMEMLAPAAPAKPFKGGWFFNKPYKELPAWKKFMADQYFFRIEPAFDIGKQILTGAYRNPGKAVTGLSLNAVPSAGMFNQTVITIPYTQIAKPALMVPNFSYFGNTAVNITKVAPALTTVEVFAKPANMAKGITAPANLYRGLEPIKAFSIISLPKIDAVLNEFHGGSSAKISPLKSATHYSLSAIPSAPKAAVKEEDTPADAQGEGFEVLKHYAEQTIKKRSVHKMNKGRVNNLIALSSYMSPKLTKELLDVMDKNPYGGETFDTFIEAIADMAESLKGNEIITLAIPRIKSLKTGPIDEDAVRYMIEVADSPFEELLDFVSFSNNYMIKSIRERYPLLSPVRQKAVLSELTEIALQIDRAGAPQKPYLTGLTGSPYEWEDFSSDDMLKLALGNEIGKDIFQELKLKKKTVTRNLAISKHRQWLIEKLGITPQTPAVWFKNQESTYFIYSNDGKVRIRVGSHEVRDVTKRNYHFHLEYLNWKDGSWTGPVNYRYNWFEQKGKPEEIFRDMVIMPIDYLTSKKLAIKRSQAPLPVKAVQTVEKNPDSTIEFFSAAEAANKPDNSGYLYMRLDFGLFDLLAKGFKKLLPGKQAKSKPQENPAPATAAPVSETVAPVNEPTPRFEKSIFYFPFGGSGFVAEWDGKIYAITAAHNLYDDNEYNQIWTADDHVLFTNILKIDKKKDIAIMLLPPEAKNIFEPLPLSPEDAKVGDHVISSGFLGFDHILFTTKDRTIRSKTSRGMTTSYNFMHHKPNGFCGAPLIKKVGDEYVVVGVHTGSRADHSMSFAAETSDILKALYSTNIDSSLSGFGSMRDRFFL